MNDSPHDDLSRALQDAAFATLTGRAFLRVTGEDRTRWLNGMVTNSIQALQPGEGCYNFLLNAQGRIQGDCTVWRDPDPAAEEFLLETTAAQIGPLQQHLDRFIIMDDVELLPIMDDQQALLVVGPNTTHRFTSLSLPAPPPNHAVRATYGGQPVLVLAAHAPLTPLYEVWAAPQLIAAIRIALEADAVPEIAAGSLEQLRILSGTPSIGADIRENHLPQETGQSHALHFAKGCYLGQEIVERIRSRGQVHRVFSGFRLSGAPPQLPAELTNAEGRPSGELTSAAFIAGRTFALGYVRRESLDLHQPLHYKGGDASPSELPFRYP